MPAQEELVIFKNYLELYKDTYPDRLDILNGMWMNVSFDVGIPTIFCYHC